MIIPCLYRNLELEDKNQIARLMGAKLPKLVKIMKQDNVQLLVIRDEDNMINDICIVDSSYLIHYVHRNIEAFVTCLKVLGKVLSARVDKDQVKKWESQRFKIISVEDREVTMEYVSDPEVIMLEIQRHNKKLLKDVKPVITANDICNAASSASKIMPGKIPKNMSPQLIQQALRHKRVKKLIKEGSIDELMRK